MSTLMTSETEPPLVRLAASMVHVATVVEVAVQPAGRVAASIVVPAGAV